jgi:hypothetical protein
MRACLTEIPFPGIQAGEVASITGLTEMEIYRLHPDDFGSPGHFVYQYGHVRYTLRGLCGLIEALDAAQRVVAARALEAAVERARQEAATRAGVTTPDSEDDRILAKRWDLKGAFDL